MLESFYMTAITLTTVGFGEVHPLSDAGRLFTVIILILGVGAIALGASTVAELLLGRDLGPFFQRRRVKRMIKNMQDHVVVCGYGRVGSSAVAHLRNSDQAVVVIDNADDVVEKLNEDGIVVVHGDATKDEVLVQAGINRASGLIVCSGTDSDNLFIVLSSKALNPKLRVVARSVDPTNEKKFIRAGADRVISPYTLGGRSMANIFLRPHVTEFLDVVTLDSGLELWLEELEIEKNSPIAGLTVIESDIRRKTGVTLIAYIKGDTEETKPLDENTRLESGDMLIILGTREQLGEFEDMASGS